ncbi:MAG: hypothetical protein ACK4IT_05445 [Thioalkalivibrionaceae bacterium]
MNTMLRGFLCPIRCSDSHAESEQACLIMKDRIRLSIGEEPVATFARRCGFGESLLRKYLSGAEPSAKNYARIADAAGVSLEWLGTGRGSMRRESAKPLPDEDFSAAPYARRLEKIGLLLAGMTEQEAAAFLDEMFARASDKAEASQLRRALTDLRAEVERLKKNRLARPTKPVSCRTQSVQTALAAVIAATRHASRLFSMTYRVISRQIPPLPAFPSHDLCLI